MYTVQCKLYTVQSTLYTVKFTLYTVQCTLYTMKYTLNSVQCTFYTVYTQNNSRYICILSLLDGTLSVESLMVSAATQVSLLRRHGSHSPGQLFSLSLVEAKDGLWRFLSSKAGLLIQQWWLPCHFLKAQSQCSLLYENNLQSREGSTKKFQC